MVAPVTAPAQRLYDFQEGLGSVYGRYVRKLFGERLRQRFGFETVLEAPCNSESYFASPGTQSVPFAQAGCRVTLVHHDPAVVEATRRAWEGLSLADRLDLHVGSAERLPFLNGSFDLVWNFDSVPISDDPPRLIAEMARVSRRLIWIIVPNRLNVGYPIHALAMGVTRQSSPWGSSRWMGWTRIVGALQRCGCRIRETGPIDAPPWPGFDVLHLLGGRLRGRAEEFAQERSDEDIEGSMQRLTLIERSRMPRPLKLLCAHQIYVLAEKEGRR